MDDSRPFPIAVDAPDASPVPSYLVERFRAWRATRFSADRAWYAQLADSGQRPRAMIVACCDSRIDVQNLLGAEPGELFMVRNVSNLCPPYAPDHEHHGTSAAIEYAVTELKVAHILVLGHAQCGGVAAYLDRRDREAMADATDGPTEPVDPAAPDGRFIDRWMDILEPGFERLPARLSRANDAAEARQERLRALEQEAVLCSLRNLETFPFVRQAMAAGRLTLHGAWFDFGAGALFAYDPASETFTPL